MNLDQFIEDSLKAIKAGSKEHGEVGEVTFSIPVDIGNGVVYVNTFKEVSPMLDFTVPLRGPCLVIRENKSYWVGPNLPWTFDKGRAYPLRTIMDAVVWLRHVQNEGLPEAFLEPLA